MFFFFGTTLPPTCAGDQGNFSSDGTRATLGTLHPMTPERHRRPPRCAEQFASRRATVCIFKTTTCVVWKPERVGVAHTILEEYTVEGTSASQCMQAKPRFGTELSSDTEPLRFPGALGTVDHRHGARVRRGGLECDPSERREQGCSALTLEHPESVARQLELVRDHSPDTAGPHPVDPRRPVGVGPRDALRCSQDQSAPLKAVFSEDLARLRLHPMMRRRRRCLSTVLEIQGGLRAVDVREMRGPFRCARRRPLSGPVGE